MPEAELAGAVAQFGVAGLIGWMWLSERRSGSVREKQLQEAHEMLMRQREASRVVVDVVKANTRALTRLEEGQRALLGVLGGAAVESAAGRAGQRRARRARGHERTGGA
jgi:Asp-tRNA(Asn)/Glu-tRNA(Gln) amidotransferase B subunit